MNGHLQLCSYNVHAFVDKYKKFEPQHCAAVLHEINADIVGLQEVMLPEKSTSPSPLDAIAKDLDMHFYFAQTFSLGERLYGNALLSRFPLQNSHTLNLGVKGFEARNAIVAAVPLKGLALHCVVTHFGLRAPERSFQSRTLLEYLRNTDHQPTVLLGDFNEWRRHFSATRALRSVFGSHPRLATFPARWPMLALDQIWASEEHFAITRWVHRSPRAQMASDHLPLVAKLSEKAR